MQDARGGAPDPLPSLAQQFSAECAERLSDVVHRAMSMTRSSGAAIALVDGDELVTCASSGESVPGIGTRSRISGFTGLAVKNKETLLCEDTQNDSRADAEVCQALKIHSMIVVPIERGNRVEGVLAVFFGLARAFNRAHVAMLRTLADVSATLLEREGANRHTTGPEPAGQPPVAETVTALSTRELLRDPDEPPELPLERPEAAAYLNEITDEEVEGILAQLLPASESASPAAPARLETQSAPAREKSEAAPMANRPVPGPPAPRLPVKLTPAKTEEVLPAAADPGPRRFVPPREMLPAPAFTLPAYTQRRRGGYRRVLLPLAGVAALVVAVAGFMLFRGPGVKAAPTPVPAALEPPGVPLVSTAGESHPPVVAVVPAKSESKSEGSGVILAAPPAAGRPTPSAALRASTSPATEPAPREPAMTVPRPPRPARAVEEGPPLEAPVVTFTPNSSSVELPAPKAGMPAAPRPAVVVPSRLLRKTPPAYPPLALSRHIEGTVLLQVKVGKDGSVAHVHTVKGSPLLADAASNAVKNWRYSPATRDGVPIESDVEVSVVFKLPGGM